MPEIERVLERACRAKKLTITFTTASCADDAGHFVHDVCVAGRIERSDEEIY